MLAGSPQGRTRGFPFRAGRGGRAAVRNSKRPEAGTLLLAGAELAAWLRAVKAGEYDDLG